MSKINPIKSVNYNISFAQKKSENQETEQKAQINELSNVSADYTVKAPLSYAKLDDIDFPYDLKAHVYKLSNGQKVVIVPCNGETVVKTYVNTGSMNEPDNLRGISHYIEHNLFNGSKGLEDGDFFKQVNKMGASTNASTGLDQTNYYISSNMLDDTDLDTKIKLHASMLETPLFALEKLAKEKDIVNSEINMITSDPQNIAMNKALKNLFNINTKSLDMIGGTTENITNLTRQDVVDYFNNNYYPQNMITVVTGDVKPDETIKLISKYFSSNKPAPKERYFEKLTPLENQVREDIISDKATGTTSIVAFSGPKSNDHKDRVCLDILMTLLANSPTSRIGTKIRDYGADIVSEDEKIISNPEESRAIVFMASSTDENSEKVLKDIFNTIGNIANNPPSEDELKIAKKILSKVYSSVLEDSSAINDVIGSSLLDNNAEYIKNYEKLLNEVTADELVSAAVKYLDVNRSSTIVVHPSNVSKDDIEKNYNLSNANNRISFTGAVKKAAINTDSVKEYSYQNNYRLVTINSKTNNTDVKFKLKTDIDFKPNKACSLVLSELLNEGTYFKKEDDFNAELAKDGISKSFFADDDSISCTLSCDNETLGKSLLSIKEVLDNPRFIDDDFEHAKEVIKNTILTSEKSAFDKLDSELFKGLSKGYSNAEILDDLEKLTLDDVKTLYANILRNSKGIISISAPFDRDDKLTDTVNSSISQFYKVQEFKENELKNSYFPQEDVKVLTDTSNKNQAEVVMAYKFKKNQNLKDAVTINLLNIILGGNSSSRLFSDLRENQKLAYMVKSGYSSCDDIGALSLRILTTTDNKETGEKHYDNIQKSVDGFKQHIEKLKTEKVTDEELQNAKLFLKNSILNKNHNSAGRVSVLLNSVSTPYGIKRENMLLEETDKITKDDIYNAANYIFSGNPVYSILASEDTLSANKEYFSQLNKSLQ